MRDRKKEEAKTKNVRFCGIRWGERGEHLAKIALTRTNRDFQVISPSLSHILLPPLPDVIFRWISRQEIPPPFSILLPMPSSPLGTPEGGGKREGEKKKRFSQDLLLLDLIQNQIRKARGKKRRRKLEKSLLLLRFFSPTSIPYIIWLQCSTYISRSV